MNGGSCHPLLQKDLAMLLGVHESTISRAIKDKYIYCDKGFILLSDLIPKGTEDNSVEISRRTVAKYRSELNIPDASGRKYIKK